MGPFGEYASALRAAGFSTIPVKLGEKKPAIFKWTQYCDAPVSLELLTEWLVKYKDCNIGIALGVHMLVRGVMRQLVALDIDNEDVMPDVLAALPCLGPTKKGKKGVTVFGFCAPDVENKKFKQKGQKKPAVELLAHGSQTVAPPSIHPEGPVYAWGQRSVLDTPLDTWPVFSEAVLDEIDAIVKGKAEKILTLNTMTWLGVGGGGDTHDVCVAAVGALVKRQWSDEDIKERIIRAKREAVERAGEVYNWSQADHDITEWISSAKAKGFDDDGPVDRVNFWAYLPEHRYLYLSTGALWPVQSVNARAGKDASVWLDRHQAVEQMTWIPGEPQIIVDRLLMDGEWVAKPGAHVFNLYRPSQCVLGDPTMAGPWLDHVRMLYPNEAEHIIKWCAHRVQRPGEKINHALVLGGLQGIGKDTLLEPVVRAVGSGNAVEVSPHALMGPFNGYVKAVLLRVSEARDLGEVNRYALYEHTKTLTAAPPNVLRVNEKHRQEYVVPNVCGVVFTTNHRTDSLYLPADDRRHFVTWSEHTKEDFTAAYWTDRWAWYEDGGAGHVAAYLTALDLTRFNPKAPPPQTDAFRSLVATGRAPESDAMADAIALLGAPSVLIVGDLAALTGGGLDLYLFQEWLKAGRNARAIPRRLAECGYEAVDNPDAPKDGRWPIGAGRQRIVYALSALPRPERFAAVRQWVAARSASTTIQANNGPF